MITLTIPELPESLNKILNWHWTKRKKYKDRCHLLVRSEINRLGLTRIKGSVIIHWLFVFDNKHRHDWTNYVSGTKWMEDALVVGGIIEDDNMGVIKSVEYDWDIGKERKTIITIRSVK